MLNLLYFLFIQKFILSKILSIIQKIWEMLCFSFHKLNEKFDSFEMVHLKVSNYKIMNSLINLGFFLINTHICGEF